LGADGFDFSSSSAVLVTVSAYIAMIYDTHVGRLGALQMVADVNGNCAC
jgi:hypothetical protein